VSDAGKKANLNLAEADRSAARVQVAPLLEAYLSWSSAESAGALGLLRGASAFSSALRPSPLS
jgi:hypothetical protein